MIDVQDKLMAAWVQLLDGVISVPVFDTAVNDKDGSKNHVLLRFESETEQPISSRYWTKPIMIVDVVTVFQTIIDPKVARAIANEVAILVGTTEGVSLPAQSGMQIGNVYKQSTVPINEFDGSKYYYRIVSRYSHDINQPF